MKLTPDFRHRVLAGEFVGGTFCNLGSALTAEMAGLAGFDWVLLDHEHGPGGEETLLHQLQALAATPATAVVRIAANEAARFKRVLDAGAQGVMVPYVNSAAEARAAVAAMRYPPRGIRGVSKLNRSTAFGAHFAEVLSGAHERLVTMVQIETPEAVAALEEIAAVEGADVLFVGPLDLSTQMGMPGEYGREEFTRVLRRVAAAARAAGRAAGILALDAAHVPLWRDLGFTVMAFGSDGGAVQGAFQAAAAQLRRR